MHGRTKDPIFGNGSGVIAGPFGGCRIKGYIHVTQLCSLRTQAAERHHEHPLFGRSFLEFLYKAEILELLPQFHVHSNITLISMGSVFLTVILVVTFMTHWTHHKQGHSSYMKFTEMDIQIHLGP